MPNVREMTIEQAARLIDCQVVAHDSWDVDEFAAAAKRIQKYNFGSVYVLPYRLTLAKELLGDHCEKNDVKLGSHIGLCAYTFWERYIEAKLEETEELIEKGATALDMSIDHRALTEGQYDKVQSDVSKFVSLCESKGVTPKIIELVELIDDPKKIELTTKLIAEAGAKIIKSSSEEVLQFGRPTVFDIEAMLKGAEGTGAGVMATGLYHPSSVYLYLNAGACGVGTADGIKMAEALPLVQKHIYGIQQALS